MRLPGAFEKPSRIEVQQHDYGKDYPLRASLLGIPGELRNSIYDLLFPGTDKDITKLKVLLVCRQIYHEAAILVFKTRRFIVDAKGSELASRLSFLSKEQKSLIQIVERPGTSRRGLNFYLAIEEHLRPSCLIIETNEATYLLSAIIRIESLTQVFAYSREGNSMNRLVKYNHEMRAYNHSAIERVRQILRGEPYDYPCSTAENCILVGVLHAGSKFFALRIIFGAQDRVVTVSVPRYSLSDGNWDTHINGISP
jgi:hypothetical protein